MSVVLSITMIVVFSINIASAKKVRGQKAKNIIFMVPDGMGIADVTSARIFKNGPDGDPLELETLPKIGYQRTHSRNSTVTDSAAAASAWASGEKFNNGEISCLDDDKDGICDSDPMKTVLEIAREKGKATGLIATSDITHATPAAFGAHVHNRKCEETIARQLIFGNQVDVILGGGIAANRSSCLLPHTDTTTTAWLDDILNAAAADGYAVVDTKAAMNAAVSSGADKILGLFNAGGKTHEDFRVDPSIAYPETEPNLAEMTAAALDILEENKKGFFLMIEGSQIDWANHDNDNLGGVGTNAEAAFNYLLAEMLGFDASVKVVKDWVNAKPRRKNKTLIVIVADHDTAGLAINGPYGSLSAPGDKIDPAWTTGGHTAEDTIVWSAGPGSKMLSSPMDNTDLYDVMVDVLR